jgi:hypothetical protein
VWFGAVGGPLSGNWIHQTPPCTSQRWQGRSPLVWSRSAFLQGVGFGGKCGIECRGVDRVVCSPVTSWTGCNHPPGIVRTTVRKSPRMVRLQVRPSVGRDEGSGSSATLALSVSPPLNIYLPRLDYGGRRSVEPFADPNQPAPAGAQLGALHPLVLSSTNWRGLSRRSVWREIQPSTRAHPHCSGRAVRPLPSRSGTLGTKSKSAHTICPMYRTQPRPRRPDGVRVASGIF